MNSFRLNTNHAAGWVLAGASVAAILLATEAPSVVWGGALLALAVGLLASRATWLLLLALVPLVFAVRPAPERIGIQEAIFALFAVAAVLRCLAGLQARGDGREMVRRYALPILAAGLLVGINGYVAISHDVPLTDWLRGLIPFAFLGLAIPLAIVLRERPDRLPWLWLAVALLGVLMASHVVFVFLSEGLNQPYWLLGDGLDAPRIPESQLALHQNARGPFQDRVTMLTPRATSVLLPLGLVAAFVMAGRSNSKAVSVAATGLAVLFLAAILMTLTRSMLLAVLAVIGVVLLATALWWRGQLVRQVVLSIILIVSGWGLIHAFGLESLWSYRASGLVSALEAHRSPTLAADGPAPTLAADDNVASRMDEIKIAWARFIEYPVFGNGLGSTHAMTFIGPEGRVEKQVTYVHNWPAYFLMTTGFIGWAAYAALLAGPVLLGGGGRVRTEPAMVTAMRAGVLVMAVYGLFFAVFRLIDFNLLLAIAWAMTLTLRNPKPRAT